MTITTSELLWEQDKASVDAQFTYTYTRSYLVTSDSTSDTVRTVLTQAPSASPDPLPLMYASYPGHTSAIVRAIDVQRHGQSKLHYVATVTYDTSTQEQSDDPTLWAPELTWQTTHYDRVVERDIHDDPIANSIGDVFEEPITADASRLQLNVTVYRSSFDGGALQEMVDTVNNAPFYGGAAGTVKLSGANASPTVINNAVYMRIAYQFDYRKDTWVKKILNRGPRHCLTPDIDSVPVPFDPPRIGNLDLNGVEIPRGDPLAAPLEFEVYEESDFTTLGIGS